MKFRHLTALFLTLNFLAACSASPAKEPAPTPTVTAPTTDRTLAEQNDLALKLIKQANWEEAILVATKATEIDAASAPAWFNLGRAYLGAGKAAQAVSALRQASALTKAGSADTEYYLGKALEAAGQPGEARSVYQVAKAKWPDDKEIAAALSSLPASPLIPLQEAARAYTAKPGPDTLKTLGTSLDAYLRSPDSKNMGPHGNEMGVMAVLGSPPDPRLVRLHEPGF
ncbi:MAG TPA: tetratricopeptide repeat protein, partial [Symbiobacteriaceae bacterium]|nr:tetratricopeptide repeat protein [Symbiobacteriaceae bacterium]